MRRGNMTNVVHPALVPRSAETTVSEAFRIVMTISPIVPDKRASTIINDRNCSTLVTP
jgi:hypothetical protein